MSTEKAQVTSVEREYSRWQIQIAMPYREDGRTASAGTWQSNFGDHRTGLTVLVPELAELDQIIAALQSARDSIAGHKKGPGDA